MFPGTEVDQSFASVGAYTTGEVNLTAGDRPLRVRSAGVDDALFAALGIATVTRLCVAEQESKAADTPYIVVVDVVDSRLDALEHRRGAEAAGGADAEQRGRSCRSARSSLAMVVTMRAPVAPNGWPSAIEPPCTLSLSGSTSPTAVVAPEPLARERRARRAP